MKQFPKLNSRFLSVTAACLIVSGCMSLTPVTHRSTVATINDETVQITASFNEMLANTLSVKFNGTPVINQSMGNPVFPEFTDDYETYRHLSIRYKPFSGQWQTKTVIAECTQGTPGSMPLRPACLIKVDGKDIANFSF